LGCLPASLPDMPHFDFVLGGRYRLIGPLGEGGMATVYRGRDQRLNRDVAIKILHEDLTRDPGFLARFQREAQVVASLSHPNIVPVYDVGEEQGTHYIVMEYVRGRTLKEVLDAGGALAPERATSIMCSVLDALGYAHTQGLIHRDVKPQNILITADGTPRLADFGIAHLVDGSTTRTAAILGSAHYLSPEQSRGDDPSTRSDIYACGVVLYEMLTGTLPFDGPNALAVANQHLQSAPPALQPRAPLVRPSLEYAVMRALAKDPADRFDDTTALADALEPAQETIESTAIQPLAAIQPTAAVAARAVPLQATVEAEAELVLRRSARKTYAAAVVGVGLVVAAAYAARLTVAGYTLPQYPSAPYALLPALLALAVVLSWLNTRAWRYSMDGNAAVVQWGLLSHHRFGVPVRHITTLELKQSPIDRVLGVGTVELCARDQHGRERRVIMEDLPHPRRTYEELMRHVGRATRSRGTQ